MSKKRISLLNITNDILMSSVYVEKGQLIVVYTNTKRSVFSKIGFFELVYQGEDLYLNISETADALAYSEKINLSAVNNINGVSIDSNQ